VHDWNTSETGAGSETTPGTSPLGSTGVVIGATIDMSAFGLTQASLAGTPILAPGFGHQGALLSDARRLFAEASDGLIVSASRSILSSGAAGVAAAITAQSRQIAEVLA
jgi:orotidine-5'-phosphate decarboxylase